VIIINTLKKITIIESNNLILNEQYKHMLLPESIGNKDYNLLRNYVQEHLDVKSYKEPEVIFKIMEWVSMQWKHDGYNTPPENISSYDILQNVRNGARYRCVEYGKVTADILTAFGYISRSLGISTANDAYGPGGMAHVVTEAWSNELDKWVFVDPQCCIYCKHKDRYLNFYDMYKLKAEKKFDEIEFIVSSAYLKANQLDKDAHVEDYKDFLSRYFGFMEIGYVLDEKRRSLRIALEGKGQPITFQGLPVNVYLYTDDIKDLYFPLNHTQIVFEYKEREKYYNKLMELNIREEKEFEDNMHLFAAVPDFTLHLYTNTIWFDHFEVSFDDEKWTRLEGNEVERKLKDGVNKVKARAINKAGVAGVPVSIEIEYK
jgi:hypothetical protein